MITSHAAAYDYARTVLDFAGADHATRTEVKQRIRAADKGQFFFKSNKERPEGCGWDLQECSVTYRLPIEPGHLKRQILTNYSPAASRYLTNR